MLLKSALHLSDSCVTSYLSDYMLSTHFLSSEVHPSPNLFILNWIFFSDIRNLKIS